MTRSPGVFGRRDGRIRVRNSPFADAAEPVFDPDAPRRRAGVSFGDGPDRRDAAGLSRGARAGLRECCAIRDGGFRWYGKFHDARPVSSWTPRAPMRLAVCDLGGRPAVPIPNGVLRYELEAIGPEAVAREMIGVISSPEEGRGRVEMMVL